MEQGLLLAEEWNLRLRSEKRGVASEPTLKFSIQFQRIHVLIESEVDLLMISRHRYCHLVGSSIHSSVVDTHPPRKRDFDTDPIQQPTTSRACEDIVSVRLKLYRPHTNLHSGTQANTEPPQHQNSTQYKTPRPCLPLSPTVIVLFACHRSPRSPLLHCRCPNPRWLLSRLSSIDPRLSRTGELIPEVFLIFARPFCWLAKRFPEVFAFRLDTAAARSGRGTVAFDEAIERGAGIDDASLEGCAKSAGRGAGLGRDVCFCKLGLGQER